ncbi:MAG TPA: transposase [Bryobacteraceae bacterium]|nr:transposase [Bryobacteraceae bacterium]
MSLTGSWRDADFGAFYPLGQAQLPQLVTLGETLSSWSEEIAGRWRFSRKNGITEGFHTKMEVLQRQAYGFRNFDNYRLGVKVCVLRSAQGQRVPPSSA